MNNKKIMKNMTMILFALVTVACGNSSPEKEADKVVKNAICEQMAKKVAVMLYITASLDETDKEYLEEGFAEYEQIVLKGKHISEPFTGHEKKVLAVVLKNKDWLKLPKDSQVSVLQEAALEACRTM